MDTKVLEDIGLTKREIRVYLALLELGSTTVGNIVKKTKIPNSKIYNILNRLEDRGLSSHIKIKNKKHYQASDPKAIVNIVREKERKIKDILPELVRRQSLGKEKQSVEMFEGKRAIFNFLRRLIENGKEGDSYFAFTHGEEHKDKTINTFYKDFMKDRSKKGLNVKLLANENVREIFEDVYTKKAFEKTNIRFTDFTFPHGLTIFKNSIIMVKWKEKPTLISIQSEQMAKDFREFFLQLWEVSNR